MGTLGVLWCACQRGLFPTHTFSKYHARFCINPMIQRLKGMSLVLTQYNISMTSVCPICLNEEEVGGLPLITYAPRGRGGVKPPIHFYCLLHAKRGGVQKACKNAYVIKRRPLGRQYPLDSSVSSTDYVHQVSL